MCHRKAFLTRRSMLLAILVIVFVGLSTTNTSCVLRVYQRNAVNSVPVLVQAKIEEPVTKTFERVPTSSSFVSQLALIKLLVYEQGGALTKTATTSSVLNPSFSLELVPGTYTFQVVGENANGQRILSGSRTYEVRRDVTNSIVVVTEFEQGTLSIRINIDNTIWENYTIESATISIRSRVTNEQFDEVVQFSSQSFDTSRSLRPGVWDVTLFARLVAKHGGILPSSKDLSKTISIQIDPIKVSPAFFSIFFSTEPNIAGWSGAVVYPFELPADNISAVWNTDTNELHVSWTHPSNDVVFHVYKVFVQPMGESSYTYFEFLGSTSQRKFILSPFRNSDFDEIEGIAINAVSGNRESGVALLNKSSFMRISNSTLGQVTFSSTKYNGTTLSLAWNHSGLATGYRVYTKLVTSNTWELRAETTDKELQLQLNEATYENLEKVGVSIVYYSYESPRFEISKENISVFEGGNGTPQSPFLIRTAWQLKQIGTPAYLSKGYYFKLISDIDLAGVTWTPIGRQTVNPDDAFRGALDGNGKRIINLSVDINAPGGLFGCVSDSTLTNLIVENAYVRASPYAGGVANVAIRSTFHRVGIRNSYVSARAGSTGSSVIVGGLIGQVSGGVQVIETFASSVTVHAENNTVGSGALIGRLGQTYGNNVVTKSYATGMVRFPSSMTHSIGGLIGCAVRSQDNGRTNAVSECYAAVVPYNVANGGGANTHWKGFIGINYDFPFFCTNPGPKNYFDSEVSLETTGSPNPTFQQAKTTAEMKRMTTFEGWNFNNTWVIEEGVSYPRLAWEF